jgi:hypothetical protein
MRPKPKQDFGDPQPIRLVVPVRLKRRGNEIKFVVEVGAILEDRQPLELTANVLMKASMNSCEADPSKFNEFWRARR